MATIGIYDSGIGGLTSLAYLYCQLLGHDVIYFADNAHLPFGNKSTDELQKITSRSLTRLKDLCDFVVIACNTASCTTCDKDAIRLLPPFRNVKRMVDCLVSGKSYVSNCSPQNNYNSQNKPQILFMATERTIFTLKKYGMLQSGNICVATTSELASMIETSASISLRRGSLDMSKTQDYLQESIARFKGVQKVILGCSHYLYVKKQIAQVLGNVEFIDGNCTLKKSLNKLLPKTCDDTLNIKFLFSGQNESEKYQKILEYLLSKRTIFAT